MFRSVHVTPGWTRGTTASSSGRKTTRVEMEATMTLSTSRLGGNSIEQILASVSFGLKKVSLEEGIGIWDSVLILRHV